MKLYYAQISWLLSIFLIGCSENSSPYEHMLSIDSNPVVKALFSEDITFKWHYDVSYYEEASSLNTVCNNYYSSLSADQKELVRLGIRDEAISLSLDDKVGILEAATGVRNLSSYKDYLSAGAAYFLDASKNARQSLKTYDVFQDSYLSQSEVEDLPIINSKDFSVCIYVFTMFGALGADNVGKQVYESFAEHVSSESRREVLNKFTGM